MRIRTSDSDFIINWFTVFGKYLMSQVFTLSTSESINNPNPDPSAITGPLTTSTYTDPFSTPEFKELTINLRIDTPSGTSPTLDIYLLTSPPVLPFQQYAFYYVKINPTTITSAFAARFHVANNRAFLYIYNGVNPPIKLDYGYIMLPSYWTLYFAIGGTSPSFPIYASYEIRK